VSLTRINERTGLDLVTASRFLSAFEEERLVRRDPVTKCYMLGSRLTEWGARAFDSVSIRVIAEPIMDRLRRTTDETVALYVRDGDCRVCVATVESPERVRHVLKLGGRLRITEAAGGWAMLGGLPDEEARALIRSRAQ
jgi:IclR family transcriptional regulator, KDG regulon repressor